MGGWRGSGENEEEDEGERVGGRERGGGEAWLLLRVSNDCLRSPPPSRLSMSRRTVSPGGFSSPPPVSSRPTDITQFSSAALTVALPAPWALGWACDLFPATLASPLRTPPAISSLPQASQETAGEDSDNWLAPPCSCVSGRPLDDHYALDCRIPASHELLMLVFDAFRSGCRMTTVPTRSALSSQQA